MRTIACLLGITILTAASTAAAQAPQPPSGTMSPSELPPGFAVPPGVELTVLTPTLPPPPPPPKPPIRSVGMMSAGIVFVTIGVAALVSGIVYIPVANQRCPSAGFFNFCPLDNALVGALIIHGGMLVGGAIGAPLLAKGASRLPEAERSSRAAPSISVGLGSASLRWAF